MCYSVWQRKWRGRGRGRGEGGGGGGWCCKCPLPKHLANDICHSTYILKSDGKINPYSHDRVRLSVDVDGMCLNGMQNKHRLLNRLSKGFYLTYSETKHGYDRDCQYIPILTISDKELCLSWLTKSFYFVCILSMSITWVSEIVNIVVFMQSPDWIKILYVRGHERGNPFYLWYLSRPVSLCCCISQIFLFLYKLYSYVNKVHITFYCCLNATGPRAWVHYFDRITSARDFPLQNDFYLYFARKLFWT